MRLALEVQQEPGRGDRPRPAAGEELAVAVHLGDALQPWLERARRPDLHAHAAGAVARGAMAVRRSRRGLDDVARSQQPLEPAGLDQQRSLDHLVALRLGGMHVRNRDEPLRPADEIELDELAAGVLGGLAELDLHAERGDVEHVAGSRHPATIAHGRPLRFSRRPL